MPKPRLKSEIRAAALLQAAALREAAEQRAAFLKPAPRSWHDRFLAALREGQSVRAAILAADVSKSGVYWARAHNAEFRAAWQAARSEGLKRKRSAARSAHAPSWVDRLMPLRSEPVQRSDGTAQRENKGPGDPQLRPEKLDTLLAPERAPLTFVASQGLRNAKDD